MLPKYSPVYARSFTVELIRSIPRAARDSGWTQYQLCTTATTGSRLTPGPSRALPAHLPGRKHATGHTYSVVSKGLNLCNNKLLRPPPTDSVFLDLKPS